MKLSISNIAWGAEFDKEALGALKNLGFSGLEIAPTRLFPTEPYSHLDEAAEFCGSLKNEGLCVPSMQSIWYGKKESIFGSDEERAALLAYTEQACRFAAAVGCRSLVFGCPKNRNLPDGADPALGDKFLRAAADIAEKYGCVIALEANPTIYGTNFVNTTADALALIKRVNHPCLMLNFDLGTAIQNGEDLGLLAENIPLISHVHISEPHLKPIEKRDIHKQLLSILRDSGYNRFVSVEMGNTGDFSTVTRVMQYVAAL